MTYVDAGVLAVPTAKKAEYLEFCTKMSAIFKELGVLSTVECWGEDVPDGKVTSFPMAVQKKEDETVVLSWMVWPSKEVRDAGMAKAMQDPRMQQEMPFDGKRMIYGGFQMVSEI